LERGRREMEPKRRKPNRTVKDKWNEELIKKARNAVEGYEEYLMDRLNYLELASIMKELQTFLDKKKDTKK